MARKAVSPIIAIVLIIAIVVTLGGLLSSWLSGFVSESTQSDMCAVNTMYTASEPFYNGSTGELKVKVKNDGKYGIYNFSFEADNETMIAVMPATSPSPTYILGTGKTQYVITNSTPYNITNIATIKVLVDSCRAYSPSSLDI
jgi:flagellin-like protein